MVLGGCEHILQRWSSPKIAGGNPGGPGAKDFSCPDASHWMRDGREIAREVPEKALLAWISEKNAQNR
jgi:hypothetical protein